MFGEGLVGGKVAYSGSVALEGSDQVWAGSGGKELAKAGP